jgi:hypothetical protein
VKLKLAGEIASGHSQSRKRAGPIGAMADVLRAALIGDGTVGIRALASSPQRLAKHIVQSPRLDRVKLTAALGTA